MTSESQGAGAPHQHRARARDAPLNFARRCRPLPRTCWRRPSSEPAKTSRHKTRLPAWTSPVLVASSRVATMRLTRRRRSYAYQSGPLTDGPAPCIGAEQIFTRRNHSDKLGVDGSCMQCRCCQATTWQLTIPSRSGVLVRQHQGMYSRFASRCTVDCMHPLHLVMAVLVWVAWCCRDRQRPREGR